MENGTNGTARYRQIAARLRAAAADAVAPDVRSNLLAMAGLFQKLADHADTWNAKLSDRAA
jgi:hypothetical protein